MDFYLSKADAPRLLNNSRLQSKRGQGSPNMYFLSMNTRTPALAKPEARQALAFAINRATIVQQVAGASPGPATGLRRGLQVALQRGGQLREEVPLLPGPGQGPPQPGRGGGQHHPALRLRRHPASDGRAGQIIRDSLRQLGLTVDLQPLETGVMIQKVFTDRDYDLTIQSFTSSGDPAIGYHRLYVTTENRAQYTNATSYSNPRIDDLLARASAATTPGAGPLLQGGPDDL